MLARTARGVPVVLDEWALEPKWDGWRCIARLENGSVTLTSRWRQDLTPLFPEVAKRPHALRSRRLLLDGELVALRSDGSQDFHALTRRRPGARMIFMAFDLLHLDGVTLTGETYARRRDELERLKIRHDHWLTTPCACGPEAAAALWEHTRAHSWEGVVAKRLSSPYSAAVRTRDWLKAKHPHSRDLQIDRSTWTTRERQRARARA